MPTSPVSLNNERQSDGIVATVLKWVLLGLMIFTFVFILVVNLEASVRTKLSSAQSYQFKAADLRLIKLFFSKYFIRRKDKSRALEGVRTWLLYMFPLPTIPFDDEDDPLVSTDLYF